MAEEAAVIDESTAAATEPKAEVPSADATDAKPITDEPAVAIKEEKVEEPPTTDKPAVDLTKVAVDEPAVAAKEEKPDDKTGDVTKPLTKKNSALTTFENTDAIQSDEGALKEETIEGESASEAPLSSKKVKIMDPSSQDGTETKSVTTDSKAKKKKGGIRSSSVIDAGYDEELAQQMGDGSSSSSYSEDDDNADAPYVKQERISSQPDFFAVLGEVPSLDIISLSISDDGTEQLESIKSKLSSMEQVATKDVGKFVDPLTGDIMESSSEPTPLEAEIEEEVEEEEDLVVNEYTIIEDDDLLVLNEVDEQVKEEMELEATAPPEEDDAFQTFFELDTAKLVQIQESADFEALEREAAARQLQLTTEEFLVELIERIVETCEYVNPNTILRQNLDKMKLMQLLQEKLLDLEVEQKARFFLNRKTVEYFRRKKAFRSIVDDHPENISADMEKYRSATTLLDRMLGREEETKQMTDATIRSLETEVLEMENKAKDEIQIFEDLVRKTLVRESFDKLRSVVENQLAKMELIRNEISEVRLVLIQRQHTMAMLIEKSAKLENLGEGLHMRDFEHLQTETQAMGKKIEERNNELNKLRTRCNADLHIMAHMKEKQQMLRNANSIQQIALTELLDEKKRCREFLYELKLNRGRIRKEIQEHSFQGGLLDKPALMLDYDETVDRLEKLRNKIEQLKAKLIDTQLKIQTIESRCI